jgi:hypothetical protein
MSNCNKNNTVFVDAFLYDDDFLARLDDDAAGGGPGGSAECPFPRSVCRRCGSKDVQPLNFISHSFSVPELRVLFSKAVLGDLEGKTVVDVGSRLGAVLYAGHAMSRASKIVGVEISSHFCLVQRNMLQERKMTDRASVVCSDVLAQRELMASADVVIMHNVFEFFASAEEQRGIWEKYKPLVCKKGSLLFTVPPLETSLETCGIDLEQFGLTKWVKPVHLSFAADAADDFADVDFGLYRVL